MVTPCQLIKGVGYTSLKKMVIGKTYLFYMFIPTYTENGNCVFFSSSKNLEYSTLPWHLMFGKISANIWQNIEFSWKKIFLLPFFSVDFRKNFVGFHSLWCYWLVERNCKLIITIMRVFQFRTISKFRINENICTIKANK